MEERGYRGLVTLVSPIGRERVTIKVPGRDNYCRNVRSTYPPQQRQDRRFRRLLSAGWKVVKTGESCGDDGERQEEKKDTSVVMVTTRTGKNSHGGDHASQEVKDSPNHAKRGCRGGQKHRDGQARKYRRKSEGLKIQVQRSKHTGDTAVYAPQPLRVTARLLQSAEQSAELLAELVGRSQIKMPRGVVVDVERLLMALEVGDNPLPALEAPDERPKVRILVTPDCSGSTQSWSGLGQAWSLHLSKIPDTEVVYKTNFNGKFWETDDAETRRLIESVDIVIYLGDGDGHDLCGRYASLGATVIALDSYCANSAKPRLKTETMGQGTLHWVDRVSAKEPDTWTKAIALCLK